MAMAENQKGLMATSALDASALQFARNSIADEYAAFYGHPWILGFSGGKDSTLVAHLVVEHLLELPPTRRNRKVHIVLNDTLVESPRVIEHAQKVLAEIKVAAQAFNLPIETVTTMPDLEGTFWVNLIGRGYPTPNRNFRWCTDRMKVKPTTQYIKQHVDASGEVILLLGVRRDESLTRAMSVAKHDTDGRLHGHRNIRNCWVFRPIVDVSTDEVWEFLGTEDPPWGGGGGHKALINLYRDAGGGECPVLTDKAEASSCGNSRFGCWTCTLVTQDKSLSGLVGSGAVEYAPLLEFRNWLLKIRNQPKYRQVQRRSGQVSFTTKGTHIVGPFTISARIEILDRLLALQEKTKMSLIRPVEVKRIREIWAEDIEKDNTKQLRG